MTGAPSLTAVKVPSIRAPSRRRNLFVVQFMLMPER
jgi:hypothetical protein